MQNPLVTFGDLLGTLAQYIAIGTFYFFWAVIIGVVAVVLVKLLTDALKLNPFGRVAYYLNRPGNYLIRQMRDSRFFYPLRRALGFDPAVLMVFITAALLCYVGYLIVSDFTTILWGLALTLRDFGGGLIASGIRYLIGTCLLAIIFFLLALMLIVFVNSVFGLFPKAAFRAGQRIQPLLNIFEFGGIFRGWSFLILYIALSFAAQAVKLLFFSPFGA
ncbi:MAG TPA: hypothetical protein VEF04_08650 [Blastocatellia bacterium]|nr:hypothetical protein [Blastocatellia bacterium]